MRAVGTIGDTAPSPDPATLPVPERPVTEPAPAKAFAHLDAPNAELYRRVMGVFVAAKWRGPSAITPTHRDTIVA
jgi:hypothetical protein